jgi:hypothetical protein
MHHFSPAFIPEYIIATEADKGCIEGQQVEIS